MSEAEGPDFRHGVAIDGLADGAMLRGQIDGEPALLVRHGDRLSAIA